jgi:ribosomal protein S18 acetylase RimI-like enzyme
MSGPTMRKAVPEDIEAVQEVARRSWCHTYRRILSQQAIDGFLARAYSEFALRQTINSDGLHVLEQQGECLGYVRVGASAGEGFLAAVYLVPEAQGQGYGRLLWEGARAWFEARGVRSVALTVAADNTKARGFYRHLGFEEGVTSRSAIAGEVFDEITCLLNLA